MNQSHIREFAYRCTQGLRNEYKVTLNVTQLPSAVFAYKARGHYQGIFKGNGIVFPLASTSLEEAISDARKRTEGDIEQLTGVSE
jgi:hypothetical protein